MCTEGEGVTSSLRVCVALEGSSLWDPGVPKLNAHASLSKVNQKDTTGQQIKGCLIGASEDEREGA